MSKDIERLRKMAVRHDDCREIFRYLFAGGCVIAGLLWVLAVGLITIGEAEASVIVVAIIFTCFPLMMLSLWRRYTIKASRAKRDLNIATGGLG